VPLILRFPGTVPAGRRIAALVSSVDLGPTILDLLSLPAMPGAQGKSFAAGARGEKMPSPRAGLLRGHPAGKGLWLVAPVLAERRDPTVHRGSGAELYDLRQDPSEHRNLAASSPDEVQAWRKRLEATVGSFGSADPGSSRP